MTDPFGLEPLDYAAPDPVGSRTPSIPAFIAVTGPTFFLLVIGLFVTPLMEGIYKEYKAQLPLLSRMLFQLSHFMRFYFGWVVIIMVSGIVATTYSAFVPRPTDPAVRLKHRKWAFRLSFFVSAIIAVFCILALFLPYAGMLDSLGSAKQ